MEQVPFAVPRRFFVQRAGDIFLWSNAFWSREESDLMRRLVKEGAFLDATPPAPSSAKRMPSSATLARRSASRFGDEVEKLDSTPLLDTTPSAAAGPPSRASPVAVGIGATFCSLIQ